MRRRNESERDSDGPPSEPLAYASLTCLTPVWEVSSRVTAFATTRLGGVSQSPYDSLNVGLHVGDDEQAVMENRRRLTTSFALPQSPLWLNQTHSTSIVAFDRQAHDGTPAGPADATALASEPADGAWTNQTNAVLVVMTADCLPVVISNTQGTELAVVHAGWRGLAAGILENALSYFSQGGELHAWLGPAIGPDAFEVGDEVRDAFVRRNPLHVDAFRSRAASTEQKHWADLYTLARTELQQSRSVNVTGGDYCTWTQSQWFHSFRRDGARSGRLATMAWISDVP